MDTTKHLIAEGLIGFAEAARRIGKSPRSVGRWVFKGIGERKLEARKMGGRWMTSMAAIERFSAPKRIVTVAKPDESRAERAKAAVRAMCAKGRIA